MEFFVQIEDSNGTKLGGGPLASVTRWRYTARFDRAGDISFTMAAADPQAEIVTNTRIAKAFARLNGTWVEVGAGIVDHIDTIPDASGLVTLDVAGQDLIRELGYKSVGRLAIGTGSGATHAQAVDTIEALAPAGWAFTPAGNPDNDYIYARFGGESLLGAVIQIADKTRTHFYRGADRNLIFADSFMDSGIRAIQAYGDSAPETCAIISLRKSIETYDLLTRIIPYGSGQGDARLTLAATNRTAPTGYTLNATENYIESDAAVALYGVRDYPGVEFKEITPISNTDADLQSAANMLFDVAFEELRRRSTLPAQATYAIRLAECSQLLRPMQTIRVVYRDPAQGIDIDADLNILEATWEVDSSGIRTTDLVVSTDDRWPTSDASVIADRIAEGRVFQAHPQLNANSYVTAYTKNVDADNVAEFRFRFGDEVVNLQQALFEFQLLPFESTVKSVGTESGGSGEMSTGGPSTDETGSGGNNETGSGGPTSTDPSTPMIGSATPTIGSATPTIGTTTPTIGNSTPTIGSATPTIGTATPTVGQTGLETNDPQGGDADASGFHNHAINVIAGAGNLGEVLLHKSGDLYFLSNAFVTGSEPVYVTPGGIHTHTISDHTHSINPHSHTISSHSHTISSHTHTISAHSHTISSHSHTISAHTHTIAAHTHTISAHTHSLAQHTHSLNNHTHDLSGSIEAIYGIFRADEADTYDIEDLEYRVNGGSWADLDTASNAGNGWYQLDITSQVMDSTTFRPLQTSNLLEIRAATSGPIPFNSYSTLGQHSVRLTFSTPHGLAVGQLILIEDADIGSFFGSNINGRARVTSVEDSVTVLVDPDTEGFSAFDGGAGGTVQEILTATIDAQLSVRNTIQAISYV